MVTSRPVALTVTPPAMPSTPPAPPAPPAAPATPTPIDQLTLISRSSAGTGGNGDSSGSSISADGRYVAFTSAATNLLPADTLGHLDVFLRDTVTGTTTLVSHTPTGGFPAADSYSPSISGDGRFVAFTSYAHDVVSISMPAGENVYVWERDTGTVRAALPGYAHTTSSPSMSSTGKVAVVADTTPHSVAIAGSDGAMSLTLWDDASIAGHDQQNPRLSDDGREVVFESAVFDSTAAGGVRKNVYRALDFNPNSVLQVSLPYWNGPHAGERPNGDSTAPAVSGDGRYVVYETMSDNLAPGTVLGRHEIVVTDTTTGWTSLVSAAPSGSAADTDTYAPTIAVNGSMVAYYTKAGNLVAGISSAHYDVVVQPRTGGAARLVSSTFAGALGNSDSVTPSISGDGRYVAFHSKATNFVAVDTDPTYDIYRWDALGNR